MIGRCVLKNAAVLVCAVVPAHAQSLDTLKGKFAFKWLNEPDREKCIRIDDRLLADFMSSNTGAISRRPRRRILDSFSRFARSGRVSKKGVPHLRKLSRV